jgi:prepilin-type N-terminal cleavage/methylation domain-containing protein
MRSAGFSLFELLIVIAVVGILAAVSVPRFADFRATAYDSRSQQDLRNLASAQELFRATNEEYAAEVEALSSFRASDGVEISIESADRTTFRATARHPAGATVYTWDSSASPPLSAHPRG